MAFFYLLKERPNKGTLTSIEKSLESIEKIQDAQAYRPNLIVLRGHNEKVSKDYEIMIEFWEVKNKKEVEKKEKELSFEKGKDDMA